MTPDQKIHLSIAIHEAMKKTTKWNKAWWNDEMINAILNLASVSGYIHRPSVTQVQYTKKGVRLIQNYLPASVR